MLLTHRLRRSWTPRSKSNIPGRSRKRHPHRDVRLFRSHRLHHRYAAVTLGPLFESVAQTPILELHRPTGSEGPKRCPVERSSPSLVGFIAAHAGQSWKCATNAPFSFFNHH